MAGVAQIPLRSATPPIRWVSTHFCAPFRTTEPGVGEADNAAPRRSQHPPRHFVGRHSNLRKLPSLDLYFPEEE